MESDILVFKYFPCSLYREDSYSDVSWVVMQTHMYAVNSAKTGRTGKNDTRNSALT